MILRSLLTSLALLGLTITAHSADVSGKTSQPGGHAQLKGKHHQDKVKPQECCGEVYRYVYAEAWYGSGKVVAPVRRTEFGDQVQVPGGAWIPCTFSCEYTIRKLELQYWQDQGAGYVNGLNPGAPRNDFWKDENGRHDYIF